MSFLVENFIALTLTCRICCIALMKEGEIRERKFFAVHDCIRERIKENLQKFCQKYHGEPLQVYYPKTDESEFLSGQGTAISFEEMIKKMEEYLCFRQAAGKRLR